MGRMGIQRCGRLIQKHYRCVLGQYHGEEGPLALPSRKLGNQPMPQISKL